MSQKLIIDTDAVLAEFFKVVVKVYSGSYKPHLPAYSLVDGIPISHSNRGYSFSSQNIGNLVPNVESDGEQLSIAVEKLISLGGVDSKWDEIATSESVCREVIKWTGDWINNHAKDIGYEFKQFENPKDYFNHAPLCGIYKSDDTGDWIFVHQGDAGGDNPAGAFQTRRNRYLPELVEDVIISICRQIRISMKD